VKNGRKNKVKKEKEKKRKIFQIDVVSLQVCSPKHSPPTPPSYYSLIEIEIGFDDVFSK
jgi:hypothetical protein